MGYYYFNQAYVNYKGDFLTHPRLAAFINEWLPKHQVPAGYRSFLENIVVPHWQSSAYFLTGIEFAIGVSLMAGFLVRPFALVAVLLSWSFIFISNPDYAVIFKTFMAICLMLSWLGAGRCLGLDYYFYKRHRGLWW